MHRWFSRRPWCRAARLASALPGLLLPLVAQGQADNDVPPSARWEIGAISGAASTQAYPGAAENTSGARLVPYLIYRGDRVRFERGRVSVRALRTARFELDIGTSGALGSSASDVEVRRGMPDLGDLIEIGPRLVWRLAESEDGNDTWRIELPLRGVFDIDDDFAFRGVTFEPELQFSRRHAGGWNASASISALFGSERFNDLYYEVDPAFATPARPAYDARAGLVTWRITGSVSRWVARDWRVLAFARLDHVAGAANRDSPLVLQRAGAGVGIALQWVFFRSAETAPD